MGVQLCGGELRIDDSDDVERNLLFATLLTDPMYTAKLQAEYLGRSLDEAVERGMPREDARVVVDEVELMMRVHKQREVTPATYTIPLAEDRIPGAGEPIARLIFPGLVDAHGLKY